MPSSNLRIRRKANKREKMSRVVRCVRSVSRVGREDVREERKGGN